MFFRWSQLPLHFHIDLRTFVASVFEVAFYFSFITVFVYFIQESLHVILACEGDESLKDGHTARVGWGILGIRSCAFLPAPFVNGV